MNRKIFTAVFLTLGLAGFASAQEGRPVPVEPTLKIVSFSGQIKIILKENGKTKEINVLPGGEVPEIPAGAKITVVSGDAVFSSGGTSVKANSGDSFSFTATASAGGPSTGHINVTAGSVEVTTGGQTKSVGAGQTADTSASLSQQEQQQKQQKQGEESKKQKDESANQQQQPPPPPPPNPKQDTGVVSSSAP